MYFVISNTYLIKRNLVFCTYVFTEIKVSFTIITYVMYYCIKLLLITTKQRQLLKTTTHVQKEKYSYRYIHKSSFSGYRVGNTVMIKQIHKMMDIMLSLSTFTRRQVAQDTRQVAKNGSNQSNGSKQK